MSAAVKLEVFQNGRLLQEIPLAENDVWVGRDEACVIRLDDRAISRKHALFRSTSDGVAFEKKSKFGWVKVNGNESSQATLKDGDFLELGPFEIRVKNSKELPTATQVLPQEVVSEEELAMPVEAQEVKSEMASPTSEIISENPEGVDFLTSEADPEPIAEFVASPELEVQPSSQTNLMDVAQLSQDADTKIFKGPNALKPILLVTDGMGNTTPFEIVSDEIAIGRSPDCQLMLEDKRSSRKHAVIKKKDSKFVLYDQGSANGTLVNDVRIDTHELEGGDVVKIGDTKFVFQMVQADYEVKKEQFIAVPEQESAAPIIPQMIAPVQASPQQFEIPFQAEQPAAAPFQEVSEPKKSLIGKFLDRYRTMNTRQQIIYGAAILAGLYYFDDIVDMIVPPEVQKGPRLTTGSGKKPAPKKVDQKGVPASFESLTPEQQRYVETQYQISFDLYKNREYDKALLEVGKIFSLLQDYKTAREIEAFSREGKRKLEAQEEERKKKEQERQAQLKLQSLLEQVGLLMEKKRYKEAEALFPEIELLQPENAAVSEWRKIIMGEAERLEHEKEERQRIEELNRLGWADYQKGLAMVKEQKYIQAIQFFNDLLERKLPDQKLNKTVTEEIDRTENLISSLRDPLIATGKQLEQEGKLSEAYRSFEKAAVIDPDDEEAPAGMKRIHGTLTDRARYLYAEGVFAESYSDFDTAEKRYREILEVVPIDDDYHIKSENRLKKLTVFKKPQTQNEGIPP